MTEREREYAKEMREIAEGMRAWTIKNTATPELATASLQRSGILTEDGELAPEYGGPKRRSAAAHDVRKRISGRKDVS